MSDTKAKQHLIRRRLMLIAGLAFAIMGVIGLFTTDWHQSYYANLSRQIKSRGNLYQIENAIKQYVKDNGENYPDSFQSLYTSSDLGAGVFVSPLKSDTPATGPTTQAIAAQLNAGGHMSYIYVGSGLNTATTTSSTVIAYEILDNPDNGTAVLFGDGQAIWVKPPYSSQIDAAAKTGKRPVTVPSSYYR